MPVNPPLTAARPIEPQKQRPRPIPKPVREAIKLMVYGRLDDEDCAPIDFIEAAKLSNIKPDLMRRYLDRADVRALLMSERRAFRAAVCSGNELALRRVRDKSANGMATVAAVRALEGIEEGEPPNRTERAPGVTIIIHQAAPATAAPTIDIRPTLRIEEPDEQIEAPGPRRDANGDLIFDPRPFPYD